MRSRTVDPACAALVAISALLQLHPEHETDSFWHMTLAREVLASGTRVVTEPTAFAAFDRPAVVPEWLWGTLNLAVYDLGGWELCSIFVMLCAALASLLALRMLRAFQPHVGRSVLMLVGGILLAAMSQRLKLRPQTAAMILTPLFIAVSLRFTQSEGRRRAMLGVALCGIELLWAQLHGSFVMAPAVFAVLAVTSQKRGRGDVLLFGALLGLLATSAYGTDIASYLAAHGSGDAKEHIGDMSASDWSTFDPTKNASAAMYLLLWLLSWPAIARNRNWQPLLLALLGVPLVVVANRFVSIGSILLAPLALEGAHRVLRHRGRLIAPLVAATALALAAFESEEHHGPVGTLGLSSSGYPYAAAAVLIELPQGTRALTTFDAGGPLGFWLAGHARTYVDGRTPLYFDDTDFAIARRAFADTKALDMTARRFDVTAIVTQRAPRCPDVPDAEWIPVALDPIFTTYLRRGTPGATPLEALSPCGQDYLTKDACRDDALQRDIDRLEGRAEESFVRFLRAEQAIRCASDSATALQLLPTEHQAWYYRHQLDRVRARILMATGDPKGAVDLLTPAIEDGGLTSLRVVWGALDEVPDDQARALLQRCAVKLGDETPASLRARLAVVCLRLEDEHCVRDQAFRAAAAGNERAVGPLRWLVDHGSNERVRTQAQGWIDTFRPPR